MTSSMITGERRWASARRGGMTVLGKVAVPKPLNLPSQRLENHGLDPDVEIVPKGTLSWGSKTSSTTPNAWASSTVSPNADGGTSSPSYLSACHSSGGNGSRPSTAGSDRTHEPSVSAWGSNSRPSSASGTLSSSQTSSASLRPRSAETRPGSSQLSRFAETVTNHPAAWGAGTTAERLGILNSKNEGFSLSSGDFPTLGSEKDNSGKTSEQRGHSSHSRPSSASGKLSQDKDKTDGTNPVIEQDVKNGAVGMWRRDGPRNVDDGIQAGMDMWQGEPHQYVNADVPPQHFDAWRGPPMHPPTGVWYRGPPGGPAYGPPVGPGGFPIEPFPYYRPQMPHLANPQPVPPPGHDPRGHHPRNSDLYRPQIPDTCVRPGMPFRPGFYPGPVAFEGYYGPPMGYCNSSERDIPLMGMPPGPPVYNRYPAPNAPDPNYSHARASSRGINNKALPEQVESAHPDDARRPYKVLLKQHDVCDIGEEGESWRQTVPANTPLGDRICRSGISSQKNEWEVRSSEEEMVPKRSTMNENSTSHDVDNQRGNSSDNVKFKSVESMDNVRTAPDSWIQRSATTESSSGMAQALPAVNRSSIFPVAGKESTLMKKIEGLNAKVRAHDGHFDPPIEEEKSRPIINANVNNSVDETGSSAMCFERTRASGNPVSQPHVSTADMSRRSDHGLQGRSGHPAKAKLSYRDDGWRKQPLSADCPPSFSYPSIIPASKVHTHGSDPQVEAIEHAVTSVPGNDEKESVPESFDSVGGQAQRAKMKELAKQRALQLQKEEEERIREQKAKALAKLEELNRRTQGGDASAQMAEKAPITNSIKQEQGQSPLTESVASVSYSEAPSAPLPTKPDVVAEVNESTPSEGGEGSNVELQAKTADLQPAIAYGPTLILHQDRTATDGRLTLQSNDRHKRTGYKQRQNVAVHKNLNESSAPVAANEAPKKHIDVPVTDDVSTEVAIHRVSPVSESNTPNNSSTMPEAPLQQRRKGSRSSKNKQKMDDTPSSPASLPTIYSDSTNAKNTENEVFKASLQVLDVSSVQAAMNSINGLQSSEHHSPLSSKEGHGRLGNQLKPQHSRRISRNQHGNRFVDKSHGSDTVVWAPVRPQTKHDTDVEASQKKVPDSATPVMGDNVVQSNSKGKRAEMERYVPKPVAKELAQLGSGQLPALTSNSHASVDATTGKAESRSESSRSLQPMASTAENVGSVIESSREGGEGKTNNSRQGGAWRQRSSTEPQHVKDVHNVSSVHGTRDEKSGRNQSVKPELDSTKSVSSDLNNLDGWGMPIDSAAQLMSLGAKDEGDTAGKGKWNSTRDYKSTVNARPDHKNSKNIETGKNYNQDIKETDRMVSAKENRVSGNRASSHWKPKSHVHPVNNWQGTGSTGSRSVTVDSQVLVPQQGEEGHALLDVSSSENKTVLDLNQGSRRDAKQHSFGGGPFSANQPRVGLNESVPANAETQNEQRFASGFRRGGQNNRIGRAQESSGDWSSGHDNQQHNVHVNRERRRNNTHYEYQPVGQHNNKSSNFGGPAYSSQNVIPRYRERGQSRRGGGNFHERKGGNLRGDASYD